MVLLPKVKKFDFSYDDMGRLIQARDPIGGSLDLERIKTNNGYEVNVTTALNRSTKCLVERLPSGVRRQLTSWSDGTRMECLIRNDGTRRTTFPDGSVMTHVEGPDPRFGMQSPLPESLTITTPSGLTINYNTARTVDMSDSTDFMSLTRLTDTVLLNGKVFTSIWDATIGEITDTSPQGRIEGIRLDSQGRTIQEKMGNLDPHLFVYDDRGRLAKRTVGNGSDSRMFQMFYDTAGRVERFIDPLGQVSRYAFDDANRLTTLIYPDERKLQFAYDSNGYPIQVIPPGRPAHTFNYTAVKSLETYTSSSAEETEYQTKYTYNADRQQTSIKRPDGLEIKPVYDSSGRLDFISLPSGDVDFTYDPERGYITGITVPDGNTLSYEYDGFLPTVESWEGTINGSIQRVFDKDLNLVSEFINNSDPIYFKYDDDDLLTQAGDLQITSGAELEYITSTVIGNVSDVLTYNNFGQKVTYTATYKGEILYSYHLGYDKAGQIIEKQETILGETHHYAYTYNSAGSLSEVKINNQIISQYIYDNNSCRISHINQN